MNDPKVTIGGREFSVSEFSVKAQRKVTPALMDVAKYAGNIGDADKFGLLLDTIFLCLTIEDPTVITRDEFEALKVKPLQLATEVLPVLLTQAGLQEQKPGQLLNGKGGPAAPDTPLPGENTSTTLSPTSSSQPTANGTPSNDGLQVESPQSTES